MLAWNKYEDIFSSRAAQKAQIEKCHYKRGSSGHLVTPHSDSDKGVNFRTQGNEYSKVDIKTERLEGRDGKEGRPTPP